MLALMTPLASRGYNESVLMICDYWPKDEKRCADVVQAYRSGGRSHPTLLEEVQAAREHFVAKHPGAFL